MPPKRNPLNLNPLQLKTLTLLQELAKLEDYSKPGTEGAVFITSLPHAHGDHFHLGSFLVRAQDATGLSNQAVWTALERKGLIRADETQGVAVTADGLAYDTGLRDRILQGGGHH